MAFRRRIRRSFGRRRMMRRRGRGIRAVRIGSRF